MRSGLQAKNVGSVPALRDFSRESPIAECVGPMLNGPVRFHMDQSFYKPAGNVIHMPRHLQCPLSPGKGYYY
jgi:hypothetical protein